MNAKTRDQRRELLAKFKTPSDLHLEVSGITAEVVRPPLAEWIAMGQIPENLFNAAQAAIQQGDTGAAEALALQDVFNLALRVARASFKWPKLTDEGVEPADEDELNPATLPLPDLSRVLAWGFTGTAGTVKTTGGEVDAGALLAFRENANLSSDSGSLSDVRSESGAGVGDS